MPKDGVKRLKKAFNAKDLLQPQIEVPKNPIVLKYCLSGVCASLKNSQQIVPGTSKLLARIRRLDDDISVFENKGSGFHDKLQKLREEQIEVSRKIAAGEDRARKNWLIQCDRYRRWLQKVMPPLRIWLDDMTTKHGISFPVGHIKIKILFYFPTLNRRDGPNKEQAIFDMLKAVGMVPDDCWTVIDECNWIAKLYRPRPRTELYITIKDPHRSLWTQYQLQPSRPRKKKETKEREVSDQIT